MNLKVQRIDADNLYLEIPEEIIKQVGWSENQILDMLIQDDGTIILKKKKLTAFIVDTGRGFTATCLELNIGGVGETKRLAMLHMQKLIDNFINDALANDLDKLIKKNLKNIIKF